jgi:trimethylamine--corrinoid protein Co-methyltransferase
MSRKSSLRARRKKAPSTDINQLPFRLYENPYPPLEIISPEQVETIHEASLEILETVGVNFLLDEARRILKEAGADVEKASTRVRFDRDLILAGMSTAPASFSISARNPRHSLGPRQAHGKLPRLLQFSAADPAGERCTNRFRIRRRARGRCPRH